MDPLKRFLCVFHVLFMFLFEVCHGNSFMVGFMKNKEYDKALTIHIGRLNRSFPNASSITVKTVDTSIQPMLVSEHFLGPMDFISVAVPQAYEVTERGKSLKGIYIESDQELFVVGINRVVNSFGFYYTDVFLGIPIASLGFSYYPVTLTGKAEILIVGVYNGTKVHIISPKKFNYDSNASLFSLAETLNAFETIQLQSLINDLTGAHVTSDKAVSVYSGNQYADPGVNKNHLVQQVAPEHVWGYTHITVPPPGAAYNVIFVTGTADTHVTNSCGHPIELANAASSSSTDMGNEHCLFRSNNPVSVTMIARFDIQMIDPSMIRIQPLQRVKQLVFFVTGTIQLKLVLISDGVELLLDNTRIAAFLPVAGVDFFYSVSPVSPGHHVISCEAGCSVSGYVHGNQGAEAVGYPIIPSQDAMDGLASNKTGRSATSANSVDGASAYTAAQTNISASTSSSEQSTPGNSHQTTPITTGTQTNGLLTDALTRSSTFASSETTTSVTHSDNSFNSPSTEPPTTVPTVPMVTTITDSTGSIGVTAQTDTTEWLGGSTTSNVLNQACRCRACSLMPNYTHEELESLVAELRQKLLVKRQDTTKYTRTLVSAPDNRTSATVVGYLAGTILVTLAVGILVMDSPQLFRMLKAIKRNLSSSKTPTNK